MNTLPINTIINGESISEMKKLPDSCIDLIITFLKVENGNGTIALNFRAWAATGIK